MPEVAWRPEDLEAYCWRCDSWRPADDSSWCDVCRGTLCLPRPAIHWQDSGSSSRALVDGWTLTVFGAPECGGKTRWVVANLDESHPDKGSGEAESLEKGKAFAAAVVRAFVEVSDA